MTFKTSLVDIDKISSKVQRSNFSEIELEKLAQLILELNGIVQPLVVKEITLEKYEVIEGDFQFYGALKAWEIDDDFEMIRAFIISDRENNLVTKQINLLQQLSSDKNINKPDNTIINSSNDNLEKRINNLENRLSNLAESSEINLQNKIKEIEAKISGINEQLPIKLDVLQSFNKLSVEKLFQPLTSSGINPKEVGKIIDFIGKERKKKPFASLTDIIDRSKVNAGKRKIRLITEAKLIKIIDSWSKTAFYI